MVTNLAQVNCKVLLKLALDHAPFPDLLSPPLDRGFKNRFGLPTVTTLSLDSKKTKRNSVQTHCSPAQQGKRQYKSKRYITFPASKAQSGF